MRFFFPERGFKQKRKKKTLREKIILFLHILDHMYNENELIKFYASHYIENCSTL